MTELAIILAAKLYNCSRDVAQWLAALTAICEHCNSPGFNPNIFAPTLWNLSGDRGDSDKFN